MRSNSKDYRGRGSAGLTGILGIIVLTALASAALPRSAFAARVGATDAVRTAGEWTRRSGASSRAPTGHVRTFSAGGTNLFHLVGLARGGFAAVSAGDPDTPVLGFTTHGELPDEDDGSPLWDIIAGATWAGSARSASGGRAKAGAARRPRFDVSPASVPAPRARSGDDAQYLERESLLDDVRVSPLLQSRWGQTTAKGEPCYSYYTPNNMPCGCVATAMAQVMRFHSWPRTPVTPLARECAIGSDEQHENLEMIGGVYSWQDMPLVPTDESSLSETQRQAIGKICYDAGVTVGMWYDSSISQAYVEFAHGPFLETFGYASANSAFCVEQAGVVLTTEEIQGTLLANFDAGFPCIVGVGGYYGNGCAHAVVGDGYGYSDGNLYCHYECGWEGDHDFWFLGPVNEHYYNCGFTVFSVSYNIFPEADGPLVTGRVLDADGRAIAGARVTATVEESGVVTFTTNVTASANGVYAVMVPAGAASVRVSAENGGVSSLTNEVAVSACESVVVSDYYNWGCDGENICGNSWGNTLVVGGFSAGSEVSLAGGVQAVLTAGQAAWLNSLGNRADVVSALADVSESEFSRAELLNLDVTAAGWRGWSFGVESVGVARDGDEHVVTLAVRLDRGGRSAPINGKLRLHAVDIPTGVEETIGSLSVDDALFEHGDVATVVFRTSGDTCAVKAVVEH